MTGTFYYKTYLALEDPSTGLPGGYVVKVAYKGAEFDPEKHSSEFICWLDFDWKKVIL